MNQFNLSTALRIFTKWSLADVLNKPVPEQQTINRFGRRVGF